MRWRSWVRAWVLGSALIVGVIAGASPAVAAKYSAMSTSTAYYYGYSSTAPTSFPVPSVLATYAGSGYDAVGAGVLRSSMMVISTSYGSGPYFPLYRIHGANDAIQHYGYGQALTVPSGQDFAYLYAYGHWKGSYITRTNDAGQYGEVEFTNGTGAGSLTYKCYASETCYLNTSSYTPYWFPTSYNDPDESRHMKVMGQGKYKFASKFVSGQTVVSVVGKWDAGTSKWRVRTRGVARDGDNVQTASWETTMTGGSGGTLVVRPKTVYIPNGYAVKPGSTTTGTPTADYRTIGDSYASNLEWWESVSTTDAAEVAQLYNKAPSAATLNGVPIDDGGSTSGLILTDDDLGESDTDGRYQTWTDWLYRKIVNPITAGLTGVWDSVLWPIQTVTSLDLFAEPAGGVSSWESPDD